MIESSLKDLLKEIRGERPDNATLFEEMLFYVKDTKADGAVSLLRFDNGFGAMVFTPTYSGEPYENMSDDHVYSITWPATAEHISDYSVTHVPLGGPTNTKYDSFDEMRAILRKIRDYETPPF